uniref:Transmembrane protein 107 n=1 Tax=Bicosoecida sp. CB-2014 TaxID=1486930 RepID=A0A7S1CA11_9STRA|mmetsp:Transcript_18990/g.67062  ORF Transcript_18990/g.67062 Transcript_18990/m.67062 type:complete len:147 (+) Transcript_18990:187-627(+)
MAGALTGTLVPARFLLTLGNMIVTLLAFFHRDRNVRAGLAVSASEDDVDAASASLTFALVLSFLSVFLSFVNLVGGCSMFSARVSSVHIVLQFLSAVATSAFIVDGTHYAAYWHIFLVGNLVPLLLETAVLLQVFVFKVKPWHRQQ